MLGWQEEVYLAVQGRGYTQGEMTEGQYSFSQALKMLDEYYEFLCSFEGGSVDKLRRSLRQAVDFSHVYFNNPSLIGEVGIPTHRLGYAGKELADIGVTLAMSGEILGVDVLGESLGKSKGDVKRGVG